MTTVTTTKQTAQQAASQRRLLALHGGVLLALLILLGQLWNLQLANGALYRQRADRNRLRVVSEQPLRGVIYDRQDRQVVRNVSSFTATILPADLPREPAVQSAVFERLGKLLDLPSDEIARLVKAGRGDPFRPVRVKTAVPRETALVLEERSAELTGVHVEPTPMRGYPEGDLMGHLLGYTGPIPAHRLEAALVAGYERNDTIGLAGLEAAHEDDLRGRAGWEQVEVDATGRVVQQVVVLTPAAPGGNLALTLDLELQRRIAGILAAGMARAGSPQAAAVVMDPRNGDVLAMVSLPGYDNNLFAAGISEADYRRLSEDAWRPMVNHAIGGQYPPGSTFKLITGAAALQESVVTATTRLNSTGALALPGYVLRDWRPGGHGRLTIGEAITQSCNTCFAAIAGGAPTVQLSPLGPRKLSEYARAFGFGEKTGVRLPGEVAGLVPTEQWKLQVRGEPWFIGNTYNMAIGQGDVLATPLQLLNAVNTIANGGTLHRPRLVREVRDDAGETVKTLPPEVIRRVPVAPEHLAVLRQGMRDAVAADRGTAFHALQALERSGVRAAGKTGTAEFAGPRDAKGNLPTHAWFVGYAPHDAPDVSVVVFVYGGGEGSAVAAPVAGEILSASLDLLMGSPHASSVTLPDTMTLSFTYLTDSNATAGDSAP